ncbi:integrase, catalytic region, zinc finger, CCHC-type containing protein [Tanacetum coccineum]
MARLQCNMFRGDKVKVILVLGIRVMLLVLGETMQVDRQGLLNATTVKTENLDTYDSNCDNISNAKAVLMANISNYGSDVISEVPHSETYLNDMENQGVHAMQDFEKTPVVDFTDNEIHSDSNIIPYSQYLQETQQENIQDTNLQAQQDLMILSVIKQMLRMCNPTSKTFDASPVKMEAPKEFPKVSLVNESLKKLKFHLVRFDNVVKIRTTPDARTEVEQAKAKQPLDKELDFSCKHAQRIEELLVYVQDTCPNAINLSAKKVDVTPKNKIKKVRIEVFYFGNDHIARIIGYGDYQLENVTISRVYYIEGLGHNLFSVGQFCDADLEVAFRKNTCFIRNLEGVDLLSGSQDTNLYTVSLNDMLKTSLIYLLSKASKTKSWLWHRRLSHLNFGTLNKLAKDGLAQGIPRLKFQKDHLCSACALGKSKKSSHHPKAEDTN